MMAVSGLVIVFNLVLTAVIGIRLLRLPSTSWRSPERWLAGYFLVGYVLGGIPTMAAYAGWSDPSLGISESRIAPMNMVGVCLNQIGAACVYVFTWLTFRRSARWARALAFFAMAVLAIAYVGELWFEGFRIQVVTGPLHWLGFGTRVVAFLWVAGESFHYYGALRRRMRLGMADPLLTNRFLLWGAWSSCTFVMASSEVLARLTYYQTVGSATALSAAQPIVFFTITMTSILGSIAAGTLFLTFFPSQRYRRWVARRGAALQAV